MAYASNLFLSTSVVALFFVLVGMWKPWVVLWWEAQQNRRKVLKLYGSIALISYLAHWLIVWF